MNPNDPWAESDPERHSLIGSMKGTFSMEPGFDLTRSALEAAELAAWEAKFERIEIPAVIASASFPWMD